MLRTIIATSAKLLAIYSIGYLLTFSFLYKYTDNVVKQVAPQVWNELCNIADGPA